MDWKLFLSESIRRFSLIDIDKRAAYALQNHFRLTNYQMFVLIWFKGIWTGVLISLVLHYLIAH